MDFFYLDYIVPGSILFPLGTFIYTPGKFSYALKVLFFYLLVSSMMNVTGIMLAHYHRPNLWLLHIYTAAEATFLFLLFRLISPSANLKKAITALLLLFPAACIVNMFFFESAYKFNSYARSVEALLFIFLSVNYWLRGSELSTYETWSENPYNWIISGILLYFSSSFFLFLFSNVILDDAHKNQSAAMSNTVSLVWTLHATLVIIQYILFSIGFSKYKNDR